MELAMVLANALENAICACNRLPVARESGHGLGTRSILAFVEKYNAVIDYQADKTLFRLRLLVDNS